jgi:hypothetical protein
VYDHADRHIYFTTNSGGGRSVARIAIPDIHTFPSS